MRRATAFVAVALMVALGLPAAAGPTAGGVTSDNVEYVDYVPFEIGTATGARLVGKYLYVTSWRGFSIYDVSDATAPELMSTTPYAEEVEGFRFENEDVGTNGKILVMSETTPRSILWIYDVEDKTNPVLISQTAGLGEHTQSCLLDCKWLWGSSGSIIDIRDPAKPEKVGSWGDFGEAKSGHDVEEVAPGYVLTDTQPIQLFDARNPAKPKLLALGANEDQRFIHSIRWPRLMKDKFFFAAGETNARTRCGDDVGAFMSWETTGWKKTHSFTMVDEFRAQNGTGTDGNPPANGLGCSSHWFQQHPDFHNGGLLAVAFYEHGTKIIESSSAGKLKEVGYFMPYAGSTSAAYWITDEIVYAVDYTRGIDILKFNGKT
jgi:LVIVD repeat